MAELGRRARLKIWWAQARGGSIPPPGTNTDGQFSHARHERSAARGPKLCPNCARTPHEEDDDAGRRPLVRVEGGEARHAFGEVGLGDDRIPAVHALRLVTVREAKARPMARVLSVHARSRSPILSGSAYSRAVTGAAGDEVPRPRLRTLFEDG